MITKFKIYEELKLPQIGDWVVCDIADDVKKQYSHDPVEYNDNIVIDNIGRIEGESDLYYIIKYELPDECEECGGFGGDCELCDGSGRNIYTNSEVWAFKNNSKHSYKILHYSKDKKSCEAFIEGEKFNL